MYNSVQIKDLQMSKNVQKKQIQQIDENQEEQKEERVV